MSLANLATSRNQSHINIAAAELGEDHFFFFKVGLLAGASAHAADPQDRPNMALDRNEPKMGRQWTPNGPEWVPNNLNMGPKEAPNGTKMK